jgi:superoxide dismutase
MGAYKNLETAKGKLFEAWKRLKPPAIDGDTAKTDLKSLKTFIETSKTAWTTKTQAVVADLNKVTEALDKALKALKDAKAKDASSAIQKAIASTNAADSATKQA